MNKINGRLLSEVRKSKGLSQDDLAKKIGVSKVSICWYESGDRTPTLDNFLKLADTLDISLDELSGREVNAVAEDEADYVVKLPKRDLEILSELKNYPKVYDRLYANPVRIAKLIDKRMR